MAIINLMVVAQFFETIYTSIFKRLFIAEFTESNLYGPIFTYFRIVKTND